MILMKRLSLLTLVLIFGCSPQNRGEFRLDTVKSYIETKSGGRSIASTEDDGAAENQDLMLASKFYLNTVSELSLDYSEEKLNSALDKFIEQNPALKTRDFHMLKAQIQSELETLVTTESNLSKVFCCELRF